MAVPNIFASATSAIPLSQLDQNFATAITLGNTAVYLGNTTTSLGNVTLTNVTISSGNVTLTGANVSGTANVSTLIVTGNQTSLGNVAITGNVSANIATFSAGTAALPAITTTGDTNTGIWFPAADTIAFSEGGAEAARIDSSGNFCLGTNSVLTSGKFSLQADLSAVNAMTLRDSGTTYGVSSYYTLYQNSAGSTVGGIGHTAVTSLGINATTDLQFFTAATERARIDSSGNVGIGTSSPTRKLDVRQAYTADTIVAQIGNTNNGNGATPVATIFDFTEANGTSVSRISSIYTQSTGKTDLAFGTYNGGLAEKMRINSSGLLLVGKTSGLSTVDVIDTGTGGVRVTSGTTDLRLLCGASEAFLYNASNVPTVFSVNTTERMRIDTSGNLLVGTTSSTDSTGVGFKVRPSASGTAVTATHNSSGGVSTYHVYNINATNNGYRFYVNIDGGISNYSANNVNLSDRREKTNFAPASSYLDKICAIPVQTFNYIDQNMEDDGGLTLGVVAQDVQAVAPEMVMESNWGTEEEPKMRLSIYQTDLQYALMKCIQEMKAIIDTQASTITQLTTRITALEGA